MTMKPLKTKYLTYIQDEVVPFPNEGWSRGVTFRWNGQTWRI